MKRIMVTGGLGFIGSYFVEQALQRGDLVINVDKRTYAARPDVNFEAHGNYEWVDADICDLRHLPTGMDSIYHFAAESHVDNSILANEEFFHSNVQGVYNLLELLRAKDETDRPLLVHISTDEVYGSIREGAFCEADRLLPSNPYSATKAAAEQLVIGWRNVYALPVIVCRSCNNYGFGQYPEKLLAKTIEYLLAGKRMTIHGNGTYRREWLYAGDNCEAIRTVGERGVPGEIYNISSNEEYSVLEAATMIAESLGADPAQTFHFVPNRPGQDIRYSVSSDKVRGLGWQPRTRLRAYIPTYIALYREYLAKQQKGRVPQGRTAV